MHWLASAPRIEYLFLKAFSSVDCHQKEHGIDFGGQKSLNLRPSIFLEMGFFCSGINLDHLFCPDWLYALS